MNKNDRSLAALDLNLITALNALLEYQSVSLAADSIGRTQSAVSHSLARLRQHFRDPILVRDGWAMQLTPFGEELRPRTAVAVRAARDMFATRFDFDPATTERRIRIATPDLCTSLFTGLMSDLSVTAPSASVEFIEGSSARQAVLRSEADVGLSFGHPKPDPNILINNIAPLDWCTFALTSHEYADDTSEATWSSSRHIVVGQGGANEGPIEKKIRTLGIKRRVVCYAPNFSAALNLVVETGALFTTLRLPFEKTAGRLGLAPFSTPFEMPHAPAALIFRTDYGDPFSIWLREHCLRSFD